MGEGRPGSWVGWFHLGRPPGCRSRQPGSEQSRAEQQPTGSGALPSRMACSAPQVLEVLDKVLRQEAWAGAGAPPPAALPPASGAAAFLRDLCTALAPPLPLGQVLTLTLAPPPGGGPPLEPERMRRALGGGAADAFLASGPGWLELEVPPDLGNGARNAGVSLARLLWFVTPRQAVSLLGALLLERRVILVGGDADKVSAAVHAAAAALYPFAWQHIFLPLLPLALKVSGGGGEGAGGSGPCSLQPLALARRSRYPET